jgi:hypothetical protein
MSTQLAIYSRSSKYDPATGERTPLGNVCQRWGVILNQPVEQGRASPFWLDLEHGWAGAELCGPVRRWNAARADDILRPFAEIPPLEVVDGEVREVDRRLASDKGGAPAPAPLTELPPLTELEFEAAAIEAGLIETPPATIPPTTMIEPTPVVDWSVDRPRAAFEAAVRDASSLSELTELAVRHRDAPWMSDELRAFANARWWDLRGERAREGRVTVAVVDLRDGAR